MKNDLAFLGKFQNFDFFNKFIFMKNNITERERKREREKELMLFLHLLNSFIFYNKLKNIKYIEKVYKKIYIYFFN